MDVARKLLILIREAGYKFEMKNIRMKNFLPKEVREASSISQFFKQLQKYDKEFETRMRKATQNGKVLRYIASFEQKKALIELATVAASHPFYALSGSDNILAIHSEFYQEYPLVIKGPGAGAEFTAGAVLANIVNIQNQIH
jgi:aspartokinase/homoserine dehydrogenase 1